MIKAYLDHPNNRITVHRNPNCSHAKVGPEQKIRHLLLNPDTLSKELIRFGDNGHKFGGETPRNDMWLILDFLDPAFEEALVRHIRLLLGLHYQAMGESELAEHC